MSDDKATLFNQDPVKNGRYFNWHLNLIFTQVKMYRYIMEPDIMKLKSLKGRTMYLCTQFEIRF